MKHMKSTSEYLALLKQFKDTKAMQEAYEMGLRV